MARDFRAGPARRNVVYKRLRGPLRAGRGPRLVFTLLLLSSLLFVLWPGYLFADNVVNPIRRDEEYSVRPRRYSKWRVLSQVVGDLLEGALRLVLALVDPVHHPGQCVPHVGARMSSRHALRGVGEAYLLVFLLRMLAGVDQPEHNAVGHLLPPNRVGYRIQTHREHETKAVGRLPFSAIVFGARDMPPSGLRQTATAARHQRWPGCSEGASKFR